MMVKFVEAIRHGPRGKSSTDTISKTLLKGWDLAAAFNLRLGDSERANSPDVCIVYSRAFCQAD